jgi:hypothetical protein
MPRILSGLGASAITGPAALVLFCLVCGQSAYGVDPATSQQVRIAALHELKNSNEPAERRLAVEQDDPNNLVLAQVDPAKAGEEVVAKFPLSAPETVEEDVAKQFDLELIRRSTNDLRKERAVTFRVPSNQKAAEIEAALRADPRITSVYINKRYTLLPDAQPPSQITDLKQALPAKTESKRASRLTPKLALPSKGEAGPDERNKTATGIKAARQNSPGPGREASLATRSHAALRWPAADEPFVNVGMTNK